MGVLHYGPTDAPVAIEDRALAHLRVVIATKLRRRESFTISWRHPVGQTPGLSTLRMHESIPLRFVFDDAEPIALDPEWLQQLATAASSNDGIIIPDGHLSPAAEFEPVPLREAA